MLHSCGGLPGKPGIRIFAIDVGMGTQDVLVFDSTRNLENNPKLVLPSPTRILAARIAGLRGDLLLTGETMGGGPLAYALGEHLKRGYRVFMTPRAAMSVRDDLEQVREMGIEVVDEEEVAGLNGVTRLRTGDIDFELFRSLLEQVGEPFSFHYFAVAVQDHGRAPRGTSDRVFRFEKIAEHVRRRRHLLELGYTSPPEYYTRMCAVRRQIEAETEAKPFIADSKIAAVVGALHGVEERPAISIDIGNGHTLVALVDEDNRISGFMEHHTGLLNREKLERLIVRFAEGELTNEEVYNDSGHGCVIREAVGIEGVRRIMVTGPNRGMLRGSSLRVEFASPAGDVMMTGAVGLVDMVLHMCRGER
ncbi:MAG: DUF1786 domain-containing protein [Euryarchaeota archaeon]|nr:DUF1786 domain-containing protein [Euryarchaeota archaeon]